MAKMIVGNKWGYWAAACFLLFALFGLTGCQTGKDQFAEIPGMENVAPSPADIPPAPDDPRYLIRVGDCLIVSFTDIPTALQPLEVKVQDDGTVKLYYNETFKAEGLTESQLEKEIQARYVPKYYVRVTVMVNHCKETRYYFIGGEVRSPGQKPYLGPITLTQAIQAAGDYTDWAKKTKITVIRANGNKLIVNGKKARGEQKLDPWIYPGDKIHVPRSLW